MKGGLEWIAKKGRIVDDILVYKWNGTSWDRIMTPAEYTVWWFLHGVSRNEC